MKILPILAFSCFSIATMAQSRWGLTAGPNYSSLHHKNNSPFSSFDPRLGFSIGGVFEAASSSRFAFQMELAYTLAGAEGSDASIDLHYAMLPVSLTYAPLTWMKVGVGPQGGVLLGTNSDFDFRTLDVGVQAGLEFMLKENLSIRARNYFGFLYNDVGPLYTYLDPHDPLITTEKYKMNRNNILQLTVQYYFSKP